MNIEPFENLADRQTSAIYVRPSTALAVSRNTRKTRSPLLAQAFELTTRILAGQQIVTSDAIFTPRSLRLFAD